MSIALQKKKKKVDLRLNWCEIQLKYGLQPESFYSFIYIHNYRWGKK